MVFSKGDPELSSSLYMSKTSNAVSTLKIINF